MKNQTVIVTGASSGIGKEMSRYFIEKGSNVVMNSSKKERLEEAYSELNNPDQLANLAGDISDPETGKKLVKLALDKFNSVDVLINNAGIFSPKPFLEVTEEDLDGFWNVNLKVYSLQSDIPQ